MAADFTTTFALELEDGTSGPARQAAASLSDLKTKIDADNKALSEMQAAMRRLKGGTTTNSTAFKELQDRISAQKAGIARAQASYIDLGGTFGKVEKATEMASFGFSDVLLKLQSLPAPLMKAGAAWLAFAAAVGTGILALLRYGVVASDARRAEQLHVEGMMTIRRWHGIAAGSASDYMRSVDRASASVSLGREQVSEYARALHTAGLRGGTLTSALEAVTIASSVQGDGPARRIMGMAIAAARTGRSVEALSDKIKSRLGGIARRQMLSLDVQSRKLQESLQFLTGGLKIENFLGALGEITQMLSANTASGRALKIVFEALFNPLLEGIGGAGPLAKRFFQGMVIAALHLTIGILRVGKELKRVFGVDMFQGVDKGAVAVQVGVAALSMFAGMLIVTAAAAGLLAVALGLVVVSSLAIMAPFLLAGAAIVWVGLKLKELWDYASKQNWSEIGTSILDGMTRGVLSARTRFRAAIFSAAEDAKNAMKDALGIHSPSRAFAELGIQIPRGLAAGVETGSPSAQAAIDGLVAVPDFAGQGRTLGGQGRGTITVSIGDVYITASSESPRELAMSFRDEVERLLEGVCIEMGARS